MRDIRERNTMVARDRRQNVIPEINNADTNLYKVGDLINYDNQKLFGHVIGVQLDGLHVVNDRNKIEVVKPHQINKHMPTDRKRIVRDS